jgi:hypothetical protein
MAIFTGNINLLVAAPMLQDAFVDKNGSPMAGGTITCYHDNARTILKNWYYQSSNFADAEGNYTYSTLPNPLTLSAAGTITDINGVDTIPFFYPYDENDDTIRDPYYITIVNHFNTNQITRPNFPFLGAQIVPTNEVDDSINNLIINGSFWRNIQPNSLGITPFTSVTLGTNTVVAPSQHDALRLPDIQFFASNNSGADTATFTPFPLGFGQPASPALLPEYYLSHASNAGSGVVQRAYFFPIATHINNLDEVPFTFSILGQTGGGASSTITIFILQDPGTGGTTPNPSGIELGTITLSTTWQQYSFTGIFPSTQGCVLGPGSDDGMYLVVQMPLNAQSVINFTKPSIYLTENVIPENDFQTYDQINSIISSPRTGDLRVSVNAFAPYGWVAANPSGTIGTAASGATSRPNADTWPLYLLIYTSVSDTFAPVTGGRTAPGTTPANAFTDFTLNKSMNLPFTAGRLLGITGNAGAGFPTYVDGQSVATLTGAGTPEGFIFYNAFFKL